MLVEKKEKLTKAATKLELVAVEISYIEDVPIIGRRSGLLIFLTFFLFNLCYSLFMSNLVPYELLESFDFFLIIIFF